LIGKKKINRPPVAPCVRIRHRHFTFNQEPTAWIVWVNLFTRKKVKVSVEHILQFFSFIFTPYSINRLWGTILIYEIHAAHEQTLLKKEQFWKMHTKVIGSIREKTSN